ncbi:beta-lactamase family protein [Allosphingosinicella flava]|uniref:Beta-lactamase family protein n=1 Tax=Allosphingosinicella flava TaxID=2771430 RepID=A0A7T2GL76_9SPHN|nr:serine hydrolase domain-containing protein [Sphingosinicella flava]QPQ55872.1 beta-lactamase family protein [Sphingosinicella flava]
MVKGTLRTCMAGAALWVTAWAASGSTQTSASVTAQPSTNAQAIEAADNQLAASLVTAINSIDPAERRRWATQYHSTKDGAYSVEALTKMLTDISNAGHSVSLIGVKRRGEWIGVNLRAANGKTGQLRLQTDQADGNKVLGFNAYARPSTYPIPLVDKPVSREVLRAAIDERLKFAAAKDEFSGSVLVMKGDELIYKGAFGQADKNFAVPNTLDTRFHTGSMDKMFTATMIGQLIDEGKLTLDTRLAEVLPDYPNKDAAHKITIRHLLSHQSGVASNFGGSESDRFKPFERVSEQLAGFASKPLDFEPGTRADYSNEGFTILGAVLEKLTDTTFYDLVQKRIFDRAGMKNTVYYRIDEIAPLRAVGYRFPDEDFLGFGQRINNLTFMGFGYRGGANGGSYSTVGDMTLFLKALRAYKLMSPTLTETMTGLQKGYEQYGYGFLHRKLGDKTVRGHTGGGAFSGINGISRMVWENGYSVVVMGNYDAPLIEWVGDDIVKMVAAQP